MATSKNVSIRLSDSLLLQVDTYMKRNDFASRSDAIRALILNALDRVHSHSSLSSQFRSDLIEIASDLNLENADRSDELLMYIRAIYYLTLLDQWQQTDNSMDTLKKVSIEQGLALSPDIYLPEPEEQ